MAITKIHPIKTTLDLSIDYICDSEKTDEQILIYSYKCGYKTAALQFANTKENMNSQAKNLGRHLIQSFMPDEVSPAIAHQIGQELCEQHLKGKYEYVMTTHVDRGHIHNHIIFNNVSFIDGKAYISNKLSYHQIRNQSDELCKQHGLSVITDKSKSKFNGVSYKEYQERKSGNSYKAKLQYAIDSAIKRSKDWDDFLEILKNDGFEIKPGKHISFRGINQERFTRSKTIGPDYTESGIKERIDKRLHGKLIHTNKQRNSSKVVDIKSNKLASESIGFARWLKLQNLKNIAKTWQSISQNDISNIDSFYSYIAKVHDDFIAVQGELKNVELQIQEAAEMIKDMDTYKKYKSIYTGYQNSTDKDAYLRIHESKIILFEAASEALDTANKKPTTEALSTHKRRIHALNLKANKIKINLNEQKIKVSEVNQLKSNLETYLANNELHLNNNTLSF